MDREFIERVGWARWTWKTIQRRVSQDVFRCDNNLTLPTGLRIRLPRESRFGTEAFKTGCDVDWGSERLFADSLDPSGVVLDIGANIGYYSLYVLPVVAAVHAFEPDPRPRAALERNLRDHPNAHIHPQAVGRSNTKGVFVSEPHSELSHLSGNSAAGCEVDVVTVDSFVHANRLHVTGIKIDVEGWDIDVIEGALTTLETQAPLLLTEATPEVRLFCLIRSLNYKVFAFTKDFRTSSHPWNRTRFRLEEIAAGSDRQTKMLFLAPARLHNKFEALAS